MFLCLKRFDEIIRVGNLLDYGLAERFFERILFDDIWRVLYIGIYEVWWGLNWFWVGRKIFWKNLVWRILYIGIYKVWWCLNWLVLEYCCWKWVFEIDKNVSLFKEVWWDYSCWKFIRLWVGRKIFWEDLVRIEFDEVEDDECT